MKNPGSDPNRYDDMLEMTHHTSSVHPPMTLSNRAAQFSPFAALSGYEGQIRETARITDGKILLDENRLTILDAQLQQIQEMLHSFPSIRFTYFIADEKKSGGRYTDITGIVKKIDFYERKLILFDENLIADGLRIPVDDIIQMEILSSSQSFAK